MNNAETLWYTSYDGNTWAPQKTTPSTWSSVGPSLAAFNGKLYAAWKGMGSDETHRYSSFDGTNWAAQKQIPSTWSNVGLSIAAYKGKLYTFWKGMGNDQTIWYTSTADGNSWAAQIVLPQGILTRTGPSVAVFGAQMSCGIHPQGRCITRRREMGSIMALGIMWRRACRTTWRPRGFRLWRCIMARWCLRGRIWWTKTSF